LSKIRLSYSAVSQYLECPRKYKLHRIDRLRPTTTKSSFLFGSALGVAAERLLEGKGVGIAKNYFHHRMCWVNINGEEYEAWGCTLIKYSNADLQLELLSESYKEEITKMAEEKFEGFIFDDFMEYAKKNKWKLDEDEKKIFNNACWTSLVKKGDMFIEHMQKWIDDNIVEVHGIEIEVLIENDLGDEFIMYADFEATFKDGVRRVTDWKTSSNIKQYYPEGCADESPQLTIYSHMLNNINVAFYAIDKPIRKREPRIRDTFVCGEITEEQEDIVFGNIDKALTGIKNEEFEPNFDSCMNYGGCDYREFCKSNCTNMKGLVKLEKK
jgi:hypothetical protein